MPYHLATPQQAVPCEGERALIAARDACKEEMGSGSTSAIWGAMTEPSIRDFHAHIYYDPEQVDRAPRWPPRRSSASPSRSAISTSALLDRTRAEAAS